MTKELVIYKGEQYQVLYKYDSGYYEIRALISTYKVELVHQLDLQYQ
jgi:hypothetical protein